MFVFLIHTGVIHAQRRELDTSIRKSDWNALLAADFKHFQIDNSKDEGVPYFIARIDTEDLEADCRGSFDTVRYLDINHDDREDAVIELFGGGSGHFRSYVLFLQSDNGPEPVTCGSGSTLEVSFHSDTLFASTRYFLSGDANCCARAEEIKPIVVNGKHVKYLPAKIIPSEDGGSQTVRLFYARLDLREFDEAYSMLSRIYRSRHPYKKWLAGFQNMEHVEVETSDQSLEMVVPVKISSTDIINGRKVSHRFNGSWSVEWINGSNGYDWVLDDPKIQEVKQ